MQETLTDRQARFVFEYLIDLNASAAAVRAGYSAKTRAAQASELMRNPLVRDCIRIELAGLLAEAQVSMLELVRERRKAAFFRAGKMFDAAGNVLPLAQMEEQTRDALEVSVTWRKGEPVISFRSPNREKALLALERVHERLERQNEAYYAKLERERERKWAGEGATTPVVEEDEIAEKGPERSPLGGDQVLSGSTTDVVAAAPEIAEKPKVLSGSEKPKGLKLAEMVGAMLGGRRQGKREEPASPLTHPGVLRRRRYGERVGTEV